uniref:Uncharacterized protein n=1 Tax=Ananas comosus var. bracteatus TaxID=296719 RepID=A0A6V7PSM6_ANACO|nr:unnamed protein product [Ananas comosus var. bracteatus]
MRGRTSLSSGPRGHTGLVDRPHPVLADELRPLFVSTGSALELLGLMVSDNDPTSGIRARGHGFDSCMLQMCIGAGGGIVGLNGPASCPVAGGHVGRVMFEMA